MDFPGRIRPTDHLFVRLPSIESCRDGSPATYFILTGSGTLNGATIVDHLESAYTVLGLEYLRDVRILRSGQDWNRTLLDKN